MTNEFDRLYEEVSKSRTKTRREIRPKNINISDELIDLLKGEYKELRVEGNRVYHSNFLKYISFLLDDARAEAEADDKEVDDVVDELEGDLEDGGFADGPIEQLTDFTSEV